MRLPLATQLEVHAALSAYLGADMPAPTKAEQVAALRREALRSMAAAGDWNTHAEYQAAAARRGIEMSASMIIRAFGSWAQAKAAHDGRPVRESAEQRAIRAATLGRRREFDDYIAGVRKFRGARRPLQRSKDYDNFVQEWNATRPEDEPPLVRAATVCRQTGLGWSEAVDVADGVLSREEAIAARSHPTSTRLDCGELVGVSATAAILGHGSTSIWRFTERRDFPPVVLIYSGARAWRRADVEQYALGRYRGDTEPLQLQEEVLFTAELSSMLGLRGSSVSVYLSKEPWRVPPPDGRVSGRWWWWRRTVVSWLRRPRRHGGLSV